VIASRVVVMLLVRSAIAPAVAVFTVSGGLREATGKQSELS
jgi:hypothetical protein